MARVLVATSSMSTSFWLLMTGGVRQAMTNFSDNARALRDYKFEE